MQAVYLDGPGNLMVIDRPVPAPGPGEVRLEVVMAGICASDLSVIKGLNPVACYPLTPGHECVGVVEAVGKGVAARPGDWAVMFPSIGCGRCRACRAGRVNHCPTYQVFGINRDSGCFAEALVLPEGQLIAVPDSLRNAMAALVEPSAVGVHVNRRAGTTEGESVLVIGAGVIGMLTAMVARAMGASRVALVDRFASRGELAQRCGFSEFALAAPGCIESLRETGAFDVVFDCVGLPATMADGVAALAPGGRLVLVATPKKGWRIDVDYAAAYRPELSIILCRNYVKADFAEAIRLIDGGAMDPRPIVTATFPLSQFPAALAALTDTPEQHVKVLVEP
jgi:2-desacetyl-2-hydroxyethyl bacteriochlorophyllide A dehydrogenase